MRHLGWSLPLTALGRVRLGALAYACLGVVPHMLQINDSGLNATRRAAGFAALALLVAIYVSTYVRRRTLRVDPVLLPAMLIAAGTNLRDPMAVIGLSLGALVAQSLYPGSRRSAVARIVLVGAALPVTIALSPVSLGRVMIWYSPPILGLVPSVLLGGALVRGLYVALVHQQRAAVRETLLARTGSRLLNRTDAGEVQVIASAAAVRLSELTPGVGLLILRRDGGELMVEDQAGFPSDVGRRMLPRAALTTLQQVDTTVAQRLTADVSVLDELVGEQRQWYALALATTDAERHLLLGGRRAVPDDVCDAFQTLATQWSMAEANCGVHTELTRRAHHDPLTMLPNRALLFKRLAAAVDAGPGDHATAVLLVVDLDDFKQVNDGYGHAVGDELLVEVAARMRAVGGYHAVPARFGGDEFAMLLSRAGDLGAAVEVAEQLRTRLQEPFELEGVTVTIGASIGVAAVQPGLTAGDLLRCADIAMYSAKARGKNRVELFTGEAHGGIAQLRLLEEHLAQAVDRGEIAVEYQPQIDLRTGHCVGVEALARWHHPTRGVLPPSAFLPLAERSGQILTLGAHVLGVACQRAMAWSRLPGCHDLRVAVNIAPRQVNDSRFVERVRAALEDSGLPPQRLVLEITESELIDEPRAHRQLDAVAELGVRIAIDDFGTGYASLASLRSFPVHQLKIDRRFLAPGDAARADEMLQLVVSVGHILDLETVAVGVENEAEHDIVRRAGVPLAQGYLFTGPLPPKRFPGWFARHVAGHPRTANGAPAIEDAPATGDAPAAAAQERAGVVDRRPPVERHAADGRQAARRAAERDPTQRSDS